MESPTRTTTPLTPIRTHAMSPIESPTSAHPFRAHCRRRTSSFSSNHDRSPLTPRSSRRFSHTSRFSEGADFGTPSEERGEALGNLADELDQLDDDADFADGETLETLEGLNEQPEQDETSRDSGIDVSYRDATSGKSRAANHVRNFSKPFAGTSDRPPDEEQEGAEGEEEGDDERQEGAEDRFSPGLEDLMHTIARMTSYTSTTEDPLIPRTISLLQDLGNQTSLEAATQRYTTSTNSLTAHLTTQTKTLQTLLQALYPIFSSFTFAAPLDPEFIDETIPLVEGLAKDIPQLDMPTLHKLQKLSHSTEDVVHALSQLTDTLQMGKQSTAAAARHLKTTQTIVEDLRTERERADLARHELSKSNWEDRLRNRWCGKECEDIVNGFEKRCDALRCDLEKIVEAGA